MNFKLSMSFLGISIQSDIVDSVISSNNTIYSCLSYKNSLAISNTSDAEAPNNHVFQGVLTNLNASFVSSQMIKNIPLNTGFQINEYDSNILDEFKDIKIFSLLSSAPPKNLGEFLDMIFNDIASNTLNKFNNLIQLRVLDVRTFIYNYTIDFLAQNIAKVSNKPYLTEEIKENLKDYIDSYPFEKMRCFGISEYLDSFIENVRISILLPFNWISNGFLADFFEKVRNISPFRRALKNIIQTAIRLLIRI